MKTIFLYILIFVSTIAHGYQSQSDLQQFIYRNYVKNPGFENVKSNWTSSGGTFTVTTSTGLITGQASGDWDSSAAAQTLSNSTFSVTSGDAGTNGVASCRIKTATGTATHTIEAFDSTNTAILASATITSSTTAGVRTSVNFIFPTAATNIQLRLKSVASNEPEIYIDDCYIGQADNIQNISQATLYGTLTYAGTTNCDWANATNSTTFTSFAADADCPTPTVTGGATAPTTKIPAVRLQNLPPGQYYFVVQGSFFVQSSLRSFFKRLSDGTNTTSSAENYADTGALDIEGLFTGFISYTTTQADITVQIQAATDTGTADLHVLNSITNRALQIQIYRFPSVSEVSYRADLASWRVDANIAGANPSLGTAAQTAYVGVENSALTLTNNSGSDPSVQIPCSATNPPTGSTCAAGNESIGVSFTIPRAGDYLACASFQTNSQAGASNGPPTFQIVETPTNAQTISQEGKSRVQGGGNGNITNGNLIWPFPSVCGTFTFASTGQKVLRLFYEQLANTTATVMLADADTSQGQRDVHWTVTSLSQQVPAPLLVGSVTSSSAGADKIEHVSFGGASQPSNCTASPCTIYNSSGGVSSVTRTSTGLYVVNFNTGTFSSSISCTCSGFNHAPNAVYCFLEGGSVASSTARQVSLRSDAGTQLDGSADVICMGAK